MTISTHIESDNGEWELSANYDEIKKQYYGCSLTVPRDVDRDNNFWDNNKYLFEELFPLIEKMYHKESPVPVTVLNTPIYQYLQDDYSNIEELYEVLLFGKNLGWYKI